MSLHHTPPSKGLEQPPVTPAGPSHIELPHGSASQLELLIDMGPPFSDNVIESITACKIPPFWKQQPALWFAQIESLFQIHRIRSDDGRYHLVIGALDFEAIQEIADILASPPVIDKYVTLKTQLLARFADSADKQLHRLLTDLELGNRKPSQLLRHMRTLAGDRMSQDILRVRWLALLPPGTASPQDPSDNLLRGPLNSCRRAHGRLFYISSSCSCCKNHSPSPGRLGAADTQTIQRLGEAVTTMQQSVAHLTTLLERLLPAVVHQGQLTQRQLSGAITTAASVLLRDDASSRAALHSKLPMQMARETDVAAVDIGNRRQQAAPNEKRLQVFDRTTNISFLVDSGSVVSLIPRKCVHRKLTPTELQLFAANSSAICTFGQQPLTLELGLRRALKWSFIIADVNSAIIGADFLSHYGLIIDLSRQGLVDSKTSLATQGQVCETTIFSVSATSQHNLPNSPHREAYATLLDSHAAVFAPRPTPSAICFDGIAHHIETTGPPVFERPRRLLGDKLAAAKADFNLLLHLGVVQPSRNRYPIPRIEDILQQLHEKKVFSTLDLIRAYHQIPVAPEDAPKTAVTAPFGLFEFLGMPPGLRNARQTFQRHMNNILRGINFAACYVDDIIVFSDSHEEHLQHLDAVLRVLQENNFPVHATKFFFGQDSVRYLGYTVSQTGLKPPLDGVTAIQQFPKPKTITDLRRFLGMVNYYRRVLPNTAQQQAPLTRHLKDAKKRDKREIHWTTETEAAFQKCKDALTAATHSAFLAPDAPLTLTTDAIDSAIGASLEQQIDGHWQLLGFFSRKLSPTEQKYSTYDRELLAVFAAVKFFKHILEGRVFQFTTDIVHVRGENNVVTDTLSRISAIEMPSTLSAKIIANAQEADPELADIVRSTSLEPNLRIEEEDIWCDVSMGIVRPYLPQPLRRKAFDIIHGPAHPSARSTLKCIKQKLIWPGINQDVSRWARECLPCQRPKVSRHNKPQPEYRSSGQPIQSHPFGPDRATACTRWPVALPLPNIEADTVTSALFNHWICNFGTPLTITTDQGTQFESALFQSLARLIGAPRIRTTPYHPQANGLIECWNRTLKAALRCHAPTPWPDILPTVLLGLRACMKEDPQASPAKLLSAQHYGYRKPLKTIKNGYPDTVLDIELFKIGSNSSWFIESKLYATITLERHSCSQTTKRASKALTNDQKTSMSNLMHHRTDFNIDAEWHFFGTAHGKGSCDDVGAIRFRNTPPVARMQIAHAIIPQSDCKQCYIRVLKNLWLQWHTRSEKYLNCRKRNIA
ncbi:uncharacterized protein LOC112589413 [Harpegnathos saltator]|uniref:uncharacterized protein LOC112589413 n=1 Tax=Harpegnathos saltator TaxID=610380 RepID=UPI000DBEDFC0|nr:uncharacterized protein LOC112589413 [Harpegnathos saltator]